MPDSKLEIVVSEAPKKAINGILNVSMENFPNLEVLLFNDLLKCGQTNGQVFTKGPLIHYGTGGSILRWEGGCQKFLIMY